MGWMTKFDAMLSEARKNGAKSFVIEPPKTKFEKEISSGIIEKMMGLKIVGKTSKKHWKIDLKNPKKEKNLRVTTIKFI